MNWIYSHWVYAGLTLFDNTKCSDANSNANSACGLNSVPLFIDNFIRLGLYIAGMLSVIFLIVGGLQYVTSSGNPQRTAKARTTMLYAIGGMLLALFAFAIVDFIIGSFIK